MAEKRTLGASEREEFLRAAFRVLVISSIEPERFVFLGTRVRRTPRWHPSTDGHEKGSGRTTEFLPTGPREHNFGLEYRQGAGHGSVCGSGGFDQREEVFHTYLKDVLLPTLERGQDKVVMDNLWAHKAERVRELIEGKGCQLSSTYRPIGRTSIP